MKLRFLTAVIISSLILTACLRTSILDEILFLSVIGYDPIDNKNTLITGLTPIFIKDQPVQNVHFEAAAPDCEQSIDKLQSQTGSPIKTGNLMVAIFNNEIAETRGIINKILFFKRDPNIGSRVYLAITEDKANTLLSGSYGLLGNGHYINGLIEDNIEDGNLPNTNMHQFLFDYFQDGKDPVLPVLKILDKSALDINKLALFKDDKLVSTVPRDDLFFAKLLIDRETKGMFHFHINDTEVTYENIKSRVRFSLEGNNNISVHINLKGMLNDFQRGKLNSEKIKLTEDKIAQQIETRSLNLVESFKELKIDPVGFGEYARSKTRNFDIKEWEDNYQDLRVSIKVNVKILDTGTFD